MIDLLYALLATARSSLKSRRELALDILGCDGQLAAANDVPYPPRSDVGPCAQLRHIHIHLHGKQRSLEAHREMAAWRGRDLE